MANHKSAQKRNRQIEARTTQSRGVRTRVRRVLRDARLAVDNGDDNAAALVKQVSSLLDRAASKNVIPKRRASRLKSRIALRLHRGLHRAASAS